MAHSLPPNQPLQPTISYLQQAFPIRDDEIRVVDLLPRSGLEAIVLKCRTISLSGIDSYEALSYVWGDLSSKRTVEISGYNVEITQILYAALQQLRHFENPRTLWIDQVCINQEDDDEKAHQVRLMRGIYKKCSQCVIWLGEIPTGRRFATLDAENALDFIRCIALEPARNVQTNEYSHIFLTDTEVGERARKAFEALVMGGNPWWSRVWTLQEASLPCAATLHWGAFTMPLEVVELAAKNICQGWFCHISSKKVATEYHDLMKNFLYPVRGLSIARARETPLDTLMRWRYRKATDPRDKVYGFVGLFRSDTLPSIPALRNVSYSISPTVLFAQVTLDLIRFTKDLRPLIGARELLHVTAGLPTWAIDFASSSNIGPRQTKWWQHSHRYHRWAASKGFDLRVEVSENDKSLSLYGIPIDYVQTVGEVYYVHDEDEIDDKSLRRNIVQSYGILKGYQTSRGSDLTANYIGGGSVNGAFWRTMLGNLIMGEMPKGVPRDDDVAEFEAYVNKGRHGPLTLSLHGLVPNHAFFITARGYLGIGPSDVREGDVVCVLSGGRVPFVIRTEESLPGVSLNTESSRFHLLGDAYVHGIMRGEAVKEGEEQRQLIELI